MQQKNLQHEIIATLLPTGSQEWCLALQAQIAAAVTGQEWYAVVDPFADEQLPGILWHFDSKPEIWPLFMNTLKPETCMQGPLFVRLQPQSQLTEWLTERACTQAVGLIYEVHSAQSASLFEHLQNLLECLLPEGKKGLFRFYDPRILFALSNALNQLPYMRVPGPATSVHAWEPGRGVPLHLRGPGTLCGEEGITLEEQLLDEISRYTMPYAVISSMQGRVGTRLRALPLPEVFQMVLGVCSAMYDLEIKDVKSCTIATSFAMQVEANIFCDERVKRLIYERPTDNSLIEVLRQLPDAIFEEAQSSFSQRWLLPRSDS